LIGKLKLTAIAHGLTLVLAVCALMTSVVIGAIAFPWLLAGSLDGRWQAMVAFAIWLGLSAAQGWLFLSGIRHHNGARANLHLLASVLPAVAFIYVVSL
jgi:hypothetical protein